MVCGFFFIIDILHVHGQVTSEFAGHIDVSMKSGLFMLCIQAQVAEVLGNKA